MYKICFTVKKITADSVFPAAEIFGRMVKWGMVERFRIS